MKCSNKTNNESQLEDLISLLNNISTCSESMINKTFASHIDMLLNKPFWLKSIEKYGWSSDQKKFVTPISREKLSEVLNSILKENINTENLENTSNYDIKELEDVYNISNEYRRLIIEVRITN